MPQARPAREPIFNIPAVLIALVAAFVVVHLWRLWVLTDASDLRFIYDYALIPARWSIAFMANGADAVMNALPAGNGTGAAFPRFIASRLLQDRQAGLWTALSYAFLHGSWTHLIFNSIWLVAFGAPLARRWGVTSFLGFCGFTALAGAFACFLLEPYSTIPTIGASGIVSGMFGASPWYAFGRDFGFGQQGRMHHPRFTLAGMLRNPTAVVFVVFWIFTVYMTAALPGLFTGEEANIAWQVHVGGFVAAFLAFPLIDDRIPKT